MNGQDSIGTVLKRIIGLEALSTIGLIISYISSDTACGTLERIRLTCKRDQPSNQHHDFVKLPFPSREQVADERCFSAASSSEDNDER